MDKPDRHASISFDRAADIYDDTRGFPAGVSEQVAAATSSFLAHSKRVLEIGIGTGRISIPLTAGGVPMFGIDLSSRMLSRLRQNLPAGVSSPYLVLADACHLPFSDSSLDAVMAVHVFHLISNPETALDEIQRVLVDGGSLYLGYDEHDTDTPISRIREHWRDITLAYRETAGLPKRWEFSDVEERVAVNGLHLRGKILAASWEREINVPTYLERLQGGYFSATWNMPEPVLRRLIDELRSWILAEYGTLELICTEKDQFIWIHYQVP